MEGSIVCEPLLKFQFRILNLIAQLPKIFNFSSYNHIHIKNLAWKNECQISQLHIKFWLNAKIVLRNNTNPVKDEGKPIYSIAGKEIPYTFF